MATDAEVITLARTLYPDLTTLVVSDAYLEAWIPWANALVGAVPWGTLYDLGRALLLAHVAYRDVPAAGGSGSGPGGPLTSLSTLGLSAGWGSGVGSGYITPTEEELTTTKPGQRFLATRQTLPNAVLLAPVC